MGSSVVGSSSIFISLLSDTCDSRTNDSVRRWLTIEVVAFWVSWNLMVAPKARAATSWFEIQDSMLVVVNFAIFA